MHPDLERILGPTNTEYPSVGSGPSFLISNEEMLSTLRRLPQDRNIVLLTPMIPPTGTPDLQVGTEDPFEPLGRALAEDHPRVKHVPFVPSIGMNSTHEAFLRTAGAVIVVICDTSDPVAVQINSLASTSPAGQREFAIDVFRALSVHEATELREPEDAGVFAQELRCPAVLVKILRSSAGFQRSLFKDDLSSFFPVIVSYSYAAESLRAIADLIFRGQ